ncbi:MAG: hypothetical protein D6674_00245 [Acidobacteria bacterium]|nr:MAG: hypothetical protein D6674_00245 [Acidobacteriota bacterium]
MNNKRGYVLLFTLWMISFMSLTVFTLLASLREVYIRESTAKHKLAFIHESPAVAKVALWKLLNSYEPTYTGILSIPSSQELTILERKYKVLIEAEDAKLPINRVDNKAVENLLKILLKDGNMHKDLALKLIAERVHNNKGLDSINEIYYILGEDKFRRLKDYISTYISRTNLNYAHREVLYSLGFSKSEVEAVEVQRKQAILDINWFRNYNKDLWERIQNYVVLTPRPTYYRVKILMIEPIQLESTFVLSPDLRVVERF